MLEIHCRFIEDHMQLIKDCLNIILTLLKIISVWLKNAKFQRVIEDQVWVPTNGYGEHNWFAVPHKLVGDSTMFDSKSTKKVDGDVRSCYNLKLWHSQFHWVCWPM